MGPTLEKPAGGGNGRGKLGEKMYAQQQAEGAGAPEHEAAGAQQQAKKDEGDVVDAEFTEVKDKK